MNISKEAPFSLAEVSAKWRVGINELLRMAVDRSGLKLATWYEGPAAHKDFDVPSREAYSKRYNGWAMLPAKISGRLIVEEAVDVSVLIKKGNCCFMPLEHGEDLGPKARSPTVKHTVYRSKLVVMAEEVTRMEAEHPELLGDKTASLKLGDDSKGRTGKLGTSGVIVSCPEGDKLLKNRQQMADAIGYSVKSFYNLMKDEEGKFQNPLPVHKSGNPARPRYCICRDTLVSWAKRNGKFNEEKAKIAK